MYQHYFVVFDLHFGCPASIGDKLSVNTKLNPHFWLNIWFQWIDQTQKQNEPSNIKVFWIGATNTKSVMARLAPTYALVWLIF